MHIMYRDHKQVGDYLTTTFHSGGSEPNVEPYETTRVPAVTISARAEIIRYGDLCYAQGYENAKNEHEAQGCDHRRVAEQAEVLSASLARMFERTQRIMDMAAEAWKLGERVAPESIRTILMEQGERP